MQSITIEDFQQNFYDLIERVESGESFMITSVYGRAMLIPYQVNKTIEDDVVKIYTDHNEGS